MKKQFLIIAVILALAVCLKGCGTTVQAENNVAERFIIIYQGSHVWVFADRETGVEYAMVNNGHGGVEFQPLYNADGTLQVYEGDE